MSAKWPKACYAAYALSLAVACSHSATGPTNPPGPALPSPGLRIVGPDTMWNGERTQFALIETRADGSATDVTRSALWSQSTPSPGLYVFSEGSVLAVLNSGTSGGGTVLADYGGAHVAHPVTISATPGGTYRLFGTVTSSGYEVPDVRVEVISGPYAARHAVAMTGDGGSFSLYAAGDFDVRMTKDGYVERTEHVSLTGDRRLNVNLEPRLAPVDAIGSYSVTVEASGCDASFPTNLKTRTYSASIRAFGVAPNRIELTFGGAAFGVPQTATSAATPGNRLIGLAEPGAVSFPLNEVSADETSVLSVDEVIDADTRLSFRGVMLRASATGDGFAGSLYQGIHLWRWSPTFSEVAACRSAAVRLLRSGA